MASTVTVSLTETGTVESSRASVHGSTGLTLSPTRTRRRRPIGTTAQALGPTIRTSRAALRRGSQFLLRRSRGQAARSARRGPVGHGARWTRPILPAQPIADEADREPRHVRPGAANRDERS